MNLYRDSTINVISFFISIIIFFLSEFLILYFSEPTIQFQANFNEQISEKEEIQVSSNNQQSNSNIQNLQSNKSITEEKEETGDWYLVIPKIELKANIAEGTSKETMELYVGHFEETSKLIGNVGLAAHNRGYSHNYFENLKKLKVGDEIRYYYKGQEKRYEVEKQKIIQDTDWSILENTEENRITLITCVENEPAYRRCIQAREK